MNILNNKLLEMDNYKLEQENLRYIEKKIKLCHSIYSLLKNICKNNYENEIYTYNLIPQFLIQCKYIPEAVECVMSIIQENNYILNKLNENIKMNIDDKLAQESNVIKVIINLKDEADEALTPQEVRDGMNPEEKKLKVNYFTIFLDIK